MPLPFTICIADFNNPAVQALIAEHHTDIAKLSPAAARSVHDQAALQDPCIDTWTIWNDAHLLGMIALKRHNDKIIEIKSLRVLSPARRQGCATQLIQFAIQQAHLKGYRSVYLETGRQAQFENAIALFKSLDFIECAAFVEGVADRTSVYMKYSF